MGLNVLVVEVANAAVPDRREVARFITT